MTRLERLKKRLGYWQYLRHDGDLCESAVALIGKLEAEIDMEEINTLKAQLQAANDACRAAHVCTNEANERAQRAERGMQELTNPEQEYDKAEQFAAALSDAREEALRECVEIVRKVTELIPPDGPETSELLVVHAFLGTVRSRILALITRRLQ